MEGGSEDVLQSRRQTENRHVSANAELPGILYGWVPLLHANAPIRIRNKDEIVRHLPGSLVKRSSRAFVFGAGELQ